MSDEEKGLTDAIAETDVTDEHTTEPNAADEHTTAPNPRNPQKWEMPKPVFQKTSGYLPQGSTFQNLYVFALLILVILIRPSGLFGKAAISKV